MATSLGATNLTAATRGSGLPSLVEKLATALHAGPLSEADELPQALRVARHNTGAVTDKLSQLDRCLGLEQPR